MTTASNALSQNESKAGDENEKENHMRGLFFDLLACLGGGDHPNLPPGFQQKPMTGFCKILDAFNETIKLHEIGSGTVCEVGSTSSDIVSRSSSDGVSTSDSRENSADSSIPPESRHSSYSKHSSSRYVTLTETNSANNDDTVRDSTAEQIAEKPHLDESTASESETTDVNGNAETYVSSDTKSMEAPVTKDAETHVNFPLQQKRDINNNANRSKVRVEHVLKENQPTRQHILNEMKTQACLSAPVLHPVSIDEVGPPLPMQQSSPYLSSMPQQKINETEGEMYRYSDEIREIERILRENIIPPPYPQFGGQATNVSSHPSNHINSILIGGGMVQPFSDVLTPPPTCDTAYDAANAESIELPFQHPQSPYFLSTYESCTSFTSGQNQTHVNPYLQSRESMRRTPSLYMDCLNLEESDNEIAPFSKALDSINPTFVCAAGAHGISKERKTLAAEVAGSISTIDEKLDVLQSYMESHEEPAGDTASSCQEFKDFEDSEVSSGSPTRKTERKKKHDYITASSDDDHLWTSASASDFEDVD